MNSGNVRLFYLLEAILALLSGIILPVYVVYFRHYGVTLFEVALLASVLEATIIIFEIPTGIFADRYGRKLSTITGFLLFGLSGLMFLKFKGFAGFLAAEIVFGIAETFISGALEALIVDSLDKSNRDSLLPRLFSNRTAVRTGGMLVGMVGGGIIAKYALPLLFAPMIGLGSLGTIVALFLSESERRLINTTQAGALKGLKTLGKTIIKSRIISALFLVGLLSNLVYEGADQYWQVLFSEIKGIDVAYFGLIAASGAVLTMLFVRFSARYYSRLASYLAAMFFTMAVCLVVMARVSSDRIVTALIIYFALKELIRPALSTHLNRRFESTNRATYLSGFNMTCSAGEVAAGIIVGILAGKFGVPFVFYFSAAAALAVPIIFLILSQNDRQIRRGFSENGA